MSGPDDDPVTFEKRLRAARERQGIDPASAAPPDKEPSALIVGMRVAVELVAAFAVAVGIGWALDRWLGTTPLFICVFVLLGGAAGALNVWRVMGSGR